MRKVAFEEHFGTAELMARRRGIPLSPEDLARTAYLSSDISEERLPSMDSCDIAVQVLQTAASLAFLSDDPSQYADCCRAFNDHVAGIIASHPKRFTAFTGITMVNPDREAQEVERCISKHGFIGAKVTGRGPTGHFLDEDYYRGIWEVIDHYGKALYLHPGATPKESTFMYRDLNVMNGPPWSWGIDTATYIMRMIFSGTFDKFPNAKLVVGHMGEMIPYFLWRIDNRWQKNPGDSKNKFPPSYYFKKNIFLGISGCLSEPALRCAIDVVGADQILFAVDYPFESNQEASDFIEKAAISNEDRQKICYLNAERVFGIHV